MKPQMWLPPKCAFVINPLSLATFYCCFSVMWRGPHCRLSPVSHPVQTSSDTDGPGQSAVVLPADGPGGSPPHWHRHHSQPSLSPLLHSCSLGFSSTFSFPPLSFFSHFPFFFISFMSQQPLERSVMEQIHRLQPMEDAVLPPWQVGVARRSCGLQKRTKGTTMQLALP